MLVYVREVDYDLQFERFLHGLVDLVGIVTRAGRPAPQVVTQIGQIVDGRVSDVAYLFVTQAPAEVLTYEYTLPATAELRLKL